MKQASDENKENINQGPLVDPISNSPNWHHKDGMAGSKESFLWDLGSERVHFIGIVQYKMVSNQTFRNLHCLGV